MIYMAYRCTTFEDYHSGSCTSTVIVLHLSIIVYENENTSLKSQSLSTLTLKCMLVQKDSLPQGMLSLLMDCIYKGQQTIHSTA